LAGGTRPTVSGGVPFVRRLAEASLLADRGRAEEGGRNLELEPELALGRKRRKSGARVGGI